MSFIKNNFKITNNKKKSLVVSIYTTAIISLITLSIGSNLRNYTSGFSEKILTWILDASTVIAIITVPISAIFIIQAYRQSNY